VDFLDFNLTHYLDALAGEYRANGYDVVYQPFHYGADFLPLAASATQSVTVLIDHDSDFILSNQQVAAFDVNGDNVGLPNVLCTITSDTSQRQLQSQAIPVISLFGTGQRPHLLFKPLLLPSKSSFTAKLQNLNPILVNVRLTFSGVKAFLQRGR
jgi:hypothetical protein